MKKNVAASASEAIAPKKSEFSLTNKGLFRSRIYTICGKKGEARCRFGENLRV